jgi:hypothetical protein
MRIENITTVQCIGQTEGLTWKFTLPYIPKGRKQNKFRITSLNVAQAIYAMPVASGTFPVSCWVLMGDSGGKNIIDTTANYNPKTHGQLLGITPRADDWNYAAMTTQMEQPVWIWNDIPTTELTVSFQLLLPSQGAINKWTVPQQMSFLLKVEELSCCEGTVWDLGYKPQVLASYQQSCIEYQQGIEVLKFHIRSGIMKSRPNSRWLISVVSACVIGTQEPVGNVGGQYIQSISGFSNGNIILDKDATASGLYTEYANTIRNDIAIGVYGREDQHAW